MTLLALAAFVALVALGTAVLLGHPAGHPIRRARILASHIRLGLRAACPTQCGESHTYRRPCALAPTRSSR
ncbi:hypothetical protein [Streptomyces sp. NPDC056549]|uniref:hypothetical protein n=1 Tax=Streptomyces sp. NPDC056549 TaxID=3345864 RepID=UPI003692A5A6